MAADRRVALADVAGFREDLPDGGHLCVGQAVHALQALEERRVLLLQRVDVRASAADPHRAANSPDRSRCVVLMDVSLRCVA